MDSINSVLLIGGILMFAGIVLGASSSRFGVPFLLIFLLIGMLAGVDGPGAILFDNYYLSFLIGNLALAVILLDGGLRTKMSTFKVALKPSLALATFGVLATAGILALFAMWILNLDWRLALLLGIIVGSTDAAAVFSLLRSSGTRLNDRISNTLEIESGINDPMVIFLAIVLIETLTKGQELSIQALLVQLLQQFTLGTVLGIGAGYALSEIFKRVHVNEGLQALLLSSGGVAVFALTNMAGGSGFLAVYLVGLVVGNYRHRVGESVLRSMDGLAWLGQSGMFLLLGLLVTPSDMMKNAWPALCIAMFLMLAARPLAVVASLLPFRFKAKEIFFISWVGLRGAVPIVMAIFPLLAGVQNADLIFNVAFVVVLMSLIFQGTSIPVLARLLGLNLPGKAEPISRMALQGMTQTPVEFVQYRVPEYALVVDTEPKHLVLPPECRLVHVIRNNAMIDAAAIDAIHENDIVSLMAPEKALDQLSEIFQRQDKSGKDLRNFYGDFMFDGEAILQDVAEIYGNLEINQSLHPLKLDEAIRKKLGRPTVQGDSVKLCGLLFTVRDANNGRAVKVGMKLPKPMKK